MKIFKVSIEDSYVIILANDNEDAIKKVKNGKLNGVMISGKINFYDLNENSILSATELLYYKYEIIIGNPK